MATSPPILGEMARIRSFTRAAGRSTLHPTEVDAEWNIVQLPEERLLQFSTYGSDNRKGSGVSQTVQFDERSALALIAAIEETFPGIRA